MASSNIARLGVVLGIDTASFKADVDKAIAENVKLKNEIKRNSEAAAKEIAALTYATKDYGKEVSKVEQIEREIAAGRFKQAAPQLLQELRGRAAAYDAIAASSKKAMGGLTSQQSIQLTYQTTDLITQIASGQNAMIALIQQGGQLKDVMGGLSPMFRMLASFITPMNVAIGASVVAVGALGYAFYKGAEEASTFRDQMILTNQYANISLTGFQNLANVASKDLKVGIGDAKEAFMSLVSSGKFTEESLGSVGNLILRVSKLSGESVTVVAGKLIPAMDGTASSAKRLNDQYHFLTLEQYKHIEALEKQGKFQDSAKLTADAFNESIKNQKRELGFLEKSWNAVAEAAKAGWAAILNIGAEKGAEEKLVALRKALESAQADITGGFANPKVAEERARRIQEQITKLEAEIESKRKKAIEVQKETEKIENYAKAGGLEKSVGINNELFKAQQESRIFNAKLAANEEVQIQIDSNEKIRQANQERQKKDRDERGVFAKQNKDLYLQQVQNILDEQNQLISKAREKAYLDDPYNKGFISKLKEHADYEKQIANNYEKASASAYELAEAENKSLEYEQAKADLQIRNLGMSEKQIAIEQTRLEYIKKQSDIRDRTDLRQSDKEALQKVLEDQFNQRVSIIETQNQYKVLEEMTTSVYKNMGDAVDKFVRTGKFQFKDFARSVIQDLLAIKMKAQLTEITGGSDGIAGFIKSIFGGGGGGGMTGAQHNMLAASFNPAAADGGDLAANKIGLVGERGPELFVPRTAGTIIPNHQLAGMGGQTINYNGTYIANMSAIDTQSGTQFLAKNKNTIWAAYQSANRGVPVSR